MSDEMPDQPKTTELPAVPQWAAEMMILVRKMSANVDNVISAVDVLRDRVNAHDMRFAEQDARATNVSERVRGASQVDLEQAAQLVQERSAREELAAKVDSLTKTQDVQLAILSRLDKIAANPQVKIILAVGATALASWAASKGLR